MPACPVDTSRSPAPVPLQGSGMTPSPATTWLFRENHECVEKTLMAQKTEDPAVFTVNSECPSPGPACPWGSPGPHRAPPDALRCSPSWQQESARVCGLGQALLPAPTEVILGVTRPEAPTPSCPVGTACLAKVEGRGQASCAPRGGFGG